MNAAEIAHALRGKRTADGFLISCPVPTHGKGNGDRNPSLLIKDGDSALLVKCFGGCDNRDVLDVLRRRWTIGHRSPPAPSTPRILAVVEHKPDPEAIEIWGSAGRALGSIVQKYLCARGITN